MHEGASRRGGAGQGGGPDALLRVLAGLLLLTAVGCASSAESSDEGGGISLPPGGGAGTAGGVPLEWIFGGQTGSLMPSCGLAPVARLQGVPSSAAFVVYTSACAMAPGAEFALVDAQGNPVPVQTQMLGSDAVLVTPPADLEPGSYTLVNLPAPGGPDQDGGFDDDGDAGPGGPASPDAGAAPGGGETLVVLAPSAAPTRLGELQQPAACSAGLELVLDPSVVPHLPSLALDLRVGDGVPERIVPFGAAKLSLMGTVHIAIPLQQLPDSGSVTVVVEGVLAGEPIAIAPASLAIACARPATQPSPSPDWNDQDEDSGCSVSRARPGRSPPLLTWLWTLPLSIGLSRRRRRRRPPS